MPRNTREWAKRKLDWAVNNLNWSATHLVAVHTVYQPQHPEIADPIAKILDALVVCSEGIQKVNKGI